MVFIICNTVTFVQFMPHHYEWTSSWVSVSPCEAKLSVSFVETYTSTKQNIEALTRWHFQSWLDCSFEWELAQKYGAQRIYLFGSYARGDMTETSDIDLRIDKGQIRGLQLAGLLLDLEEALGIPVDLIPTSSLDANFLSAIHESEVLLYEAS